MNNSFFIAHQYRAEQNEDLRQAIAQGLKETGLTPVYADDVYVGANLLDKILNMVNRSWFGIYDLTGLSPNVMLELGAAITARKPLYILAKKGTDLPTDIKGIECIEYDALRLLTEELRFKVAPRWKLPKEDCDEQVLISHNVCFHRAESLYHRDGGKVEDKDASNRVAWRFGPKLPIADQPHARQLQHAIYGPYEALPDQGLYKAYFRMKIEDNTRPDGVVMLEVSSMDNPVVAKAKGERLLRGIDFREPNTYQLFAVPFAYGSEDDLEYRLHQVADNVCISVDYVAVMSAMVENKITA